MANKYKADNNINIVLIIVILIVGALTVFIAKVVLDHSEQSVLANAQRQIGVVTNIRTRFRRIYNGPDMTRTAHWESVSASPASASFHSTSHALSHGAVASPAVTTAPAASASAYYGSIGGAPFSVMQSAGSMQSYGGGAGIGGGMVGGNQTVGSTASVGATSIGSFGYSSLPTYARAQRPVLSTTDADNTTAPMAGPRRVHYSGTVDGTPQEGDTWTDTYGNTWTYSDGDWERASSQDAGYAFPIGDATWPLALMAMVFAAFVALRRRKQTSEQ